MSMLPLEVTLAQVNPVVGDIQGNSTLIRDAYDKAVAAQSDIIVFPECCLIGYPAEDLILLPHFQQRAMDALRNLADYTRGKPTALLVGTITADAGHVYNTACLLDDGAITKRYKYRLPNMGVFDEMRVFSYGPLPDIVPFRGQKLGIMICEDMWNNAVAEHLHAQQADIFIVMNASPFELHKDATRKQLAKMLCITYDTPLLYVNQVGGQDELVFDGRSFSLDRNGDVVMQAPAFTSVVQPVAHGLPIVDYDTHLLMYQAMITGLRDYVHKNGFSHVVLGLSGGIDSALTAMVAVDALGADKVHCVMLPSPYTASISLEDAAQLAQSLDVRYDIIPIQHAMSAVDQLLTPLENVPNALARENIQSRLRGLLLMAISNSTGALLVTTGNKSEMAVGYATLYGDMCGAYSVLKDVYKTDVFALAHWRNLHSGNTEYGLCQADMPERIITRAPSAELRDNQRDEDSLPPYDVLDEILHQLIESRCSVDEIIQQGYDADTVAQIAKLVKRAEYKRRQSPPGVKLTSLAFGRDWRMPLTDRS